MLYTVSADLYCDKTLPNAREWTLIKDKKHVGVYVIIDFYIGSFNIFTAVFSRQYFLWQFDLTGKLSRHSFKKF